MKGSLPITAALYALSAFLALFLISGSTLWFLLVLGVGIIASYVLRARLPLAWLPSLLLAGLLLGFALLLTPSDGPRTPAMIGGARAGFLGGQAAAILVLIQFYRPVYQDRVRPQLFALIGSTIILLISCNTYEDNSLRGLVPVAMLFAAVSLREGKLRLWRNRIYLTMVGSALLFTLGIGFGGMKVIEDHRETLLEWGNRLIGERPQTDLAGMSQQPILGPTFGLRGSAARVLRLQGKPRVLHLRGISYDTYGDGRWWPVVTTRGFQATEERGLELPVAHQNVGETRNITITRLTSDNLFLYFPLNTTQLDLGVGDAADWAADEGGPVRVRAAAPYTYHYKEGVERTQGILARPQLTNAALRAIHLTLPPPLNEQLRPLARRITQGKLRPEDKVAAVTAYLLDNYPYSLTFSPGRGDPVVSFLTAEPHRGAHCELFGSAAALLLRCVGVPTRYVTGYFAHEDQGDGTMLVRQRDAHAWCEAWIDGKGWVTVEATPPTGWPEQDKTPVELWRRVWEGIQDIWFRLVNWLGEREPSQIFLVATAPLLPIIVFFLLKSRRKRVSGSPHLWAAAPPELAALVTRFETVFSRVGTPLSNTRPWSEQLATLPEPLRPLATRFIALYLPLRFGGESQEHAPLLAVLQELETTARNPVLKEKRNP